MVKITRDSSSPVSPKLEVALNEFAALMKEDRESGDQTIFCDVELSLIEFPGKMITVTYRVEGRIFSREFINVDRFNAQTLFSELKWSEEGRTRRRIDW